MQPPEPAAGVLYLVGTPIGNLDDLSPRARRVLAGVQRIACEDTRRSGLLLQALGLKGRLISFHQHNQTARLPQLLEALAEGESVAVISDAGLPGISDPGEALVAAARQAGHAVICVPGPSAVTTALVSSGLPSGRFCFEGFLAPRSSQRRRQLADLASEPRTIVLFEAPHRLVDLLEDLLAVLGDRPLQVARELTKRHEQQVGPSVARALEHFRHTPPGGMHPGTGRCRTGSGPGLGRAGPAARTDRSGGRGPQQPGGGQAAGGTQRPQPAGAVCPAAPPRRRGRLRLRFLMLPIQPAMLLRLRLLLGSLFGGLLLLAMLGLGSQNLQQRSSLQLGVGRSVPLPTGFLVGIALAVGVISGGSTAALLLPGPNRADDDDR